MKRIVGILLFGFGMVMNLPAGQDVNEPKVIVEEPAAEEKPWSIEIVGLWESRYVSEGRDNLEEGGIVSTSVVFEIEGFSLGAWYATGYEETFDEVNLSVGYAYEISDWEFSVTYTYLNTPYEPAADHELSAAVSWERFPLLVPTAAYVYSVETEGSYFEFSLVSEIVVVKDRWTLSPFVLLGWNAGYVVDEHEGANNLQVGIESELAITENVALTGYIANSWPLEEEEGETLERIFWGGAGIRLVF